MRRKDKQHILIGIPTRDMVCHVPVMKLALQLMNENSRRVHPWRFSALVVPALSPTEYARNVIVTQALAKKNVDALWFMDEDMVPPPNAMDMLHIDSDIVACPAPVLSSNHVMGPSFSYNYYYRIKGGDGREFLPAWGNGKPMEVDGAGTACMLIKRKVLEDKRLWLAPEPVNGTIAYFRWPRDAAGRTLATDDLDFCGRARDCGYKITVIPGLKWGHYKEVDLEWIIRRIDQAVERTPAAVPTVNEWNDMVESLGGQTKERFYKPSSEANGNSPGGVNRDSSQQLTGAGIIEGASNA